MSSNISSELGSNIEKTIKLCKSEIEKIFLSNIINYIINRPNTINKAKIENKYLLSFLFNQTNNRLNKELIGIRIDYSGYYEESITKFIEIYPQYRISGFNKKLHSNIEFNLDFAVLLTNINNNKVKKYNIYFETSIVKSEPIDFEDEFKKTILFNNNFTKLSYTSREVRNMDEKTIKKTINTLFQEKF